MSSDSQTFQVIVFILAVLLYFLPSIIGKNKRNANAILALNFFLGWTLIGWVVAMVWALATEAPVEQEPDLPVPVSTKKCPDCAESVMADARKCRFCGFRFEAEKEP